MKLILIDVMMPRLDGLSALLRIREKRNLPVIVLSAKSEDTDRILGLSMGARRGDFFWALQGIMVFYTLVCWVLQWLMAVLPEVANWAVPERFGVMSFRDRPWIFLLLSMAALVLGCLGGLLMVKNKILGTIVIVISMLILLGSTMFLLLASETGIFDFMDGPRWAWLDLLPRITTGVLAVSFAGGELLIWHTIQRYVVR